MKTKQVKAWRRSGDKTIRHHRTGTCRLTGLIRFRDKNQARDALVSMRRARMRAEALGLEPRPAPARFFPCACGGFHLASQPLGEPLTGEAA